MGCCGNCGGEAPNHINDQEQDKDIEIKLSSDEAADKEEEKDES